VEVLVSPDGGVDRIKLVSQPRRMVDVMTLSAAKMWQFEPALKDGEPVRYRLILQTPRPSSQR
jgi:outer membrane biosynthesis protein TonB